MKRSTATWITLLIVGLLVANSADFFFRQSYYEVWDTAANSLSVLRAKHFAQIYGEYSRWKFHHPGPVLFYVHALGEGLFFDTLHWVRTPFPGQMLAHLVVMTGFFVASLRIFSLWLPAGRPRWWFLCGALALAVLHFTAMGHLPSYDVLLGPSAFLSNWPPHALVLPFLCLLTAGASVACGRGEDLPALALGSGFLLHMHVAQPLFVGPVFALAYAALLWREQRARDGTGTFRAPARLFVRAGRLLGGAGRRFPGTHVLTGLILAGFALPMALDLRKGPESNFAAILQHLRLHHSHKPLLEAGFYFLQYGAYTAYTPVGNAFLGYEPAGARVFLRAHAVIYTLWVAVALLSGWALLSVLRQRPITGWEEVISPKLGPRPADAARFRAWAAGFLILAVALTLRWNTIQDGDMFYFNAWFTFAIYYFGALLALAVVCAALRNPPPWVASGAGGMGAGPGRNERLAGVLAVLVVAGLGANRLRLVDPSPAATRAMHADVQRLEAVSGGAEGSGGFQPARMLYFGYDTAPVAVAVALQLARDHVPFAAEDEWRVFIGGNHRWNDLPEAALREGQVQSWRFAYRSALKTEAGAADQHVTTVNYLLDFTNRPDDIVVRYSAAPLDPAAPGGAVIQFQPGGNAPEFTLGGWSGPEPWGTWSDAPHAMLGFRPVPVEDEGGSVEITLSGLVPFLDPAHGLNRQELQVYLGAEPLGPGISVTQPIETLVYRVPAVRWNRQGNFHGDLLLELPNATSPASLDPKSPNGDARQIGVGLREVRFRLIPPTKAAGKP